MNQKELLTESAITTVLTGIFKALGVDKAVATQVVNDPLVKKEIQNLKRSMEVIADAGERLKKIRSHNNTF
jgi:hypothetical protein